MKISDYISVKIRIISFVAILCVVLGHCVAGNGSFDKFVSGVFAQWHVPWFYFVSGMMLSYSLERHPVKRCFISKVRTLIIPYLLWCIVGFIVGVFSGVKADLNHWLGLTTAFPEGNSHLWYLHCLIIFSFISALLWGALGMRYKTWNRLIMFAIVYCVVFLLAEGFVVSTIYGTPTSPFYFLFGIVAARVVLQHLSSCNRKTICFYLVLSAAVLLRVCWFLLDLHGMNEQLLRMFCVISQISAMWFGYDFLVCIFQGEAVVVTCPWCINTVFFIYCFHGFILKPIKGLIGDNMILSFITTLIISLIVAWVLKKVVPKIYGLLTGGR